MTSTPCRGTVHVVDDNRSVREALAAILLTAAVDVIASASAEEFLDTFERQSDSPRCLVLDVHMPGLSGLGLQSKLAEESESIPIIFLTGQADLQTAVKAMKRGAVDFVEKPVHPHILLDKVRLALDLDAQSRYRRMHRRKLDLKLLSDREREVMELLLAAKNTKEISASLGIGVQTVSKHRASLFAKLAVRNVAELVQKLSPEG
jgi:two-component system response regulator TtrR